MYVCLHVYITQASGPFLENRRAKYINLLPKSPQVFSIQRKSTFPNNQHFLFFAFKNRHNMLNLESSLYLKNKNVCRSRSIGADSLFHETALHCEMNRKQIEYIIM